MPQAERAMLDRIPLENELSHRFSHHFNRKMKALLKYERRTPIMRRLIYQIKTAAAIFLVILLVAFGTVMSVEAYRVRLFEFVTQVWEELTSIMIHSSENADYDILIPISPSYIPEGYNILEQTSDKYENTVIYYNENGFEIYYSQRMATQSEIILDSEDIEPKKIMIGLQEGYIIVNKGIVQLYWHNEFGVFSLIGNLDESELIKMAEHIVK